MSPRGDIVAKFARRVIARLPLPIATPAELRRHGGKPPERPLARRTASVSGPDAQGVSTLGDALHDAGATLLPPTAQNPADIVLLVLGANTTISSLVSWSVDHGAVLRSVSPQGRVLFVLRGEEPSLTSDALHGFLRSLSREVGRKAVTVNAIVSPDPALAAPTAVFLASDRASFVSGQTLFLHSGSRPGPSPSKTEVALVTGAARGIGAAIARSLASARYRVAVIDVESQAAAGRELVGALGGEAAGMLFQSCDVRDQQAAHMMLERVRALSPNGTLDVLINNAGITRDRTFARMNQQEWADVIEVNLAAVVELTRKALGCMRDGGRIVNVSSVTGLAGNFGQTNYAMAKGGIIGLTRTAATELESRGIGITAVAPGLIDTPMTAKMPLVSREIAKQMTSLAQAGLPEDVATAVEFLARREAWPLRGQILRVDGGMFFGG